MTGPYISADSPCKTPEKLYVEVAGTDIHPGYDLILEKNGEPVANLSMAQRRWHQRYECDYAVDASECFDHTLTLTVEKEQGGYLKFPLLDAPTPTRLSARIQSNVLFPVYPLAQMPGMDGEKGPALMRCGYLYVFWKGILWRELQINETGKMRDIDLADCRERLKAEGPSVVERREPSSVLLDTLWLPACFQKAGRAQSTIGEVELAWSEQQWSWEYIESLESGLNIIHLPETYRQQTGIPAYGKRGAHDIDIRRQARCKNLKTLDSYEFKSRFGPDKQSGHDWVSLKEAPACRRRDPDREKEASNPSLVSQSLEGTGLHDDNTILHKIRDELEQIEGFMCKATETIEFASSMNQWVDDVIGEEWRALSGADTTKPEGQETSEAARRDLLHEVIRRLQIAAAEEDQLARLRESHIPGVLLPDVLFELEWLTHQASLHLTYLSSLAQSTQKHPHFKSAMLVHSAVFDYKGYERGPFTAHQNLVDASKLDAALRKEDRDACRATCYKLIQQRIDLLENQAVPVFNDLFALNKCYYPVAMKTLNLLLSHFDTSAFHFDPLAGRVAKAREAYRDSAGARYIIKLAKGQAGLSVFVVVDSEPETDQKAVPELNDGSGRPRPGLMKWLQIQLPKIGQLPEFMREHYALSEREKEKVLESIQKMADPKLLQWAMQSYTTMGQLMADITSEFYLKTQRAILREIGDGPIYQVKETLQVPVRYMKLGNPFFGSLVLEHANPAMLNPNPVMVPLGIRFGDQGAGIGALSSDRLNEALYKPNGSAVVRPKGGVINRVGPGMSGNYAVIRNANGRMLANATSVAGLQGLTPVNSFQAELFLAHKDSVAAKMSRGFMSRAGSALMRWAPPGMLGVFGFNVVSAVQGISSTVQDAKFGKLPKDIATLAYGLTNLMYWLGHIVEAEHVAGSFRLSWLTDARLEVDKILSERLKSLAMRLFSDRVLSYAKFAGFAGAALEVFLSIWEGIDRLQANDTDAAAGYFTAAAGFGVFMFSHWAGAGVIPILGITLSAALAAVALIVALAALAWAIFNTDDAFETWLKHGPFGKQSPASQFQHLHDNPDDAFQFLVNAIFPIKGTDGSLAKFNDRGLLSAEEKDWLSENERTKGHVIAISTAAFSLTDRPEEQFKAHFWVTKGSGGKVKPLTPEFVYYDAERYMLRFHLPKPQLRWADRSRSRSLEQFKVKVQIVLGNGDLLPASDMEQPLAQSAIEPGFSGVTPRWLTVSG